MREIQSEYILRLRKESILDKKIPLGVTPPPRPDFGPDYETYYIEKFTREGNLGLYEALNPMVRIANG